jgi:ABC-2 type transport system permease protein
MPVPEPPPTAGAAAPAGASAPAGAAAPAAPATPAPAGVIHDIGYRRYDGPRLGRGRIVGALYVHSLRTAFGLGRTAAAKIFPGIVLLIAFAVAVVAVTIRSQTGEVAVSYLQYVDNLGIPIVLFLAVVAPELVSRDLRSRVLALYFSRPLRRADYALAKLAAMVSAVWLLLAGPLLLMFLGGVFAQTGGARGSWHEFTDFLGGLGYAAMTALLLSAFAVPLASLSSRRPVAAVIVVVAFVATTPVIGVLESVGGDSVKQLAPLVNPVSILSGLESWVYRTDVLDVGRYGPVYLLVAAVLLAGCVGGLLARYRKVSA